jgi:hypothetical protein
MNESGSCYDATYHASRFPGLISDETYFPARAEVQARFCFTAEEQRRWNFRILNNLLLRAGLVPYRNEFRYALGWRALLPIRKYLGKAAYYHPTTLGGIFRRNGELIARARLS